MDLAALRQATADDHDRTEASVPLLSAEMRLDEYAAVLTRMYGFVRGWELWAADHVPRGLEPVLAARQRSRMLERDLDFLRRPLPRETAEMPMPETEAGFLGGLYVMEGSTLGGQYIAGSVEKHFSFKRGEGNAYFAGYGTETGSMWNGVRAVLKEVPEQDAGRVTAAAKQMFAAFGAWMTSGEPTAENGATEGHA